AFDLHIYPECGPYANSRTTWDVTIPVACMTPHARGSVRLTRSVPGAPLTIDHNYLGDPEGHDLAVLLDGVRIAFELASAANGDGLLGDLLEDGPPGDDDATLRTWIASHVHHYFHAAGTCKMGPVSDPMAVVAHTGEVHSLSGVYVADCAIMPQVPRANTNIPAAVVGMRIGAGISGRL
ncbi:MAG TPA: GMC family oxidoreductase, partial [Thermomicrobiales bacterium]|nr:GMC family oxidoreductase [Thermomicrobiales bacterium]